MADHLGAVENKEGTRCIPALSAWSRRTRNRATALPAGRLLSTGRDVITWAADVLIPAALEDAITEDNAADVRRRSSSRAPTGRRRPEADEILLRPRSRHGIPDIFANAGGVTVSYFEWAQNIQQFRWELDRVTGELEKVMVRAYGAVRDVANEKSVDLRTAAFVLGVRRVG